MDVLTLLAMHLKCSSKFNFSSRYFCCGVCITWLLLKINTGWLGFLILRAKKNFLSFLRRFLSFNPDPSKKAQEVILLVKLRSQAIQC